MLILCLLLLGSSALLSHAQLTKDPPNVKSNFLRHYYLPSLSKVDFKLDCMADGTPTPTYIWQLNGVELVDTQNTRVFNNGTLRILQTTDDTFGPYQCFAHNSGGSALSSIVNIEKAVMGIFPKDTSIRDTGNVKEYNYASLSCVDRPICIPEDSCRVEWKIGKGTDTSVVPDRRIAVDGDGSLHFLYVLASDSVDVSKPYYGCGLWNQAMSLLNKGSLTRLHVETSAKIPQSVQMRFSRGATGDVGHSATLQCIFSGYQIPTITWFNSDGIRLGPDKKHSFANFNRKLTINDLRWDDEMEYSCRASQGNTGKTAEANVFLNVTGPPQVALDQMLKQVKPTGTNVKLSCKTTSLPGEIPPVGPVWYYNGERITAGDTGPNRAYNLEDGGNVLVIQNIQKSNSGNIQCSSENSRGMFWRDTSLVVIDPIVMKTQPGNLNMNPGDVASIVVDATTDAQFTLKYKWGCRMGGKVYENPISNAGPALPFPNPKLQLSANRKNLTLDARGLEGQGIFKLVGTCAITIYHEFETKVLLVNVTTDKRITPAPIGVSSAGGFNPMIIAIILGVIFLFVVIFLIICLLYRNRGGDYPLGKKEVAAGHDPEKELADSGFHDLSRADGFDDDKRNYDNLSLNESLKNYESEEDDLDQEYGGDFDVSKFNEDGSFIGEYGDDDRKRPAPTQSAV